MSTSTLSPNAPIRGLIYFGKQYETTLNKCLNILQKAAFAAVSPVCYFYNGVEPLEDNKDYIELHLSRCVLYAESNHLTTNAAPRQPVVTTDMPVSDIDVPDSAAQNTSSPMAPTFLECTARVSY